MPTGAPEKTDISRGLGLGLGVNHVAFTADSLEDLKRRRERWLATGHDVTEIDHGWVHSIYTLDPDGIVVEFAVLTRDFTRRGRGGSAGAPAREVAAPSAAPKQISQHKAARR